MRRLFQFALGPVQSFVAQARRTQDFWAGSFLLSWLAGVAVLATRRQDGTLRFPVVPDAVLDCLVGRGGDCPRQGVIPNRFEALVPDGFDAGRVTGAVHRAWEGLAEAVWQADLAPLGARLTPATRAIWDRQVRAFWEMQWVIAEDESEHAALDRRKTWRGRMLPEEPGVSCHLLEGWQELSGADGPHASQLTDFWQAVRQRVGPDLREHEYLSAPGFIKRRFVRVFPSLQIPLEGGWSLQGWELSPHVPSVALMAARPWLQGLFRLAGEHADLAQALDALHDAALKLTSGHDEKTWPGALPETPGVPERCIRRWGGTPASAWFPSQLANPRVWECPTDENMEAANRAHKRVIRVAGDRLPPGPTSFYAVLVMDGDHMGTLLREQDPAVVSEALTEFTAGVPDLVAADGGFTVYAGGDDVVAFLPLPSALDAAAHLRGRYRKAFADRGMAATVSAAVIYAHLALPLTSVLAGGHALLDAVAKEDLGRDAVACEVWRPGGSGPRWALPWDRALDSEGRPVLAVLAEAFAGRDAAMSGVTSRFFYRLRERWQEFVRESRASVGVGVSVLDPEVFKDVLVMEYRQAGENRTDVTPEIARERVGWLWEQCRVVRRRPGPDGPALEEEPYWALDGALFLRFLALQGRERA